MEVNDLKNRGFLIYMVKFLAYFCIAYYGTIALIGISTAGGLYSPFVHDYLDYVSWLRYLLIHTSKFVLHLLGYDTYLPDIYTLRMVHGRGVHIGYDCIGYGVLIFWGAFVLANKGSWKSKFFWILGGSFLIWIVNVFRVSILLISINKNQPLPFNLEHHTLFNILAYLFIFILIYLFDRTQKKLL